MASRHLQTLRLNQRSCEAGANEFADGIYDFILDTHKALLKPLLSKPALAPGSQLVRNRDSHEHRYEEYPMSTSTNGPRMPWTQGKPHDGQMTTTLHVSSTVNPLSPLALNSFGRDVRLDIMPTMADIRHHEETKHVVCPGRETGKASQNRNSFPRAD